MVNLRSCTAGSNKELFIMCDYSLRAAARRPAVVEDKVVTGTPRNSHNSQGFVCARDMQTAVCLIPGKTAVLFDEAPKVTKIAVRGIHLRIRDRLFFLRATLSRRAIFVQVDMDNPDTHHDALKFENGEIVKIHHLPSGLKATVVATTTNAVDKLLADAIAGGHVVVEAVGAHQSASAQAPIGGEVLTARRHESA